MTTILLVTLGLLAALAVTIYRARTWLRSPLTADDLALSEMDAS